MPAPSKILDLIHRFRDNLSDYRSGRYNETQLRREFLDPFFEMLGWDVNNAQGYAEAYKDVVHEDAVKVGGATKAPDYGFRIGGTRKFFVEAKKPSVNLKDDISPAFQLRRYAWSAKLPLSILTDFEEFAVYDCRVKPDKHDKAATARVMYFTYSQFEEKWDEIAAVFSREAVLKGSFDRYAEATTGKRGTQEVDDVFLAEIERWRELLARNIALRNPGLSVRDLNYAVQLTIDRLVFLRIGEDRGFEPYERLRQIASGKEVYARLLDVFGEADARYNSGLFHLKAEKGRENPDTLTPRLVIDDKVFKEILTHLYYPDSPYDFNVMPADILGQVYEQFLGKVIRLTKGGRAEVEDKPEVKKAGGVYYTPTYIVAYIVQHTVGKLLEGKSPDEVSALKICDPACGSGSFLLGAYQYLLDWHSNWYIEHNPEKWARGKEPRLVEAQERRSQEGTPFLKSWKLTTAEKRRILVNNLYGVDIDPQAVEVTKLSLLLKVLEGENEGSLRQLAMFHERALPDLNDNIKCGNSLIGPDFYDGQQLGMFDVEESYRINAFNWGAEFGGIFGNFQRKDAKEDAKGAKGGGFDVVIGNPPYVFGRDWKALNIGDDVKSYLGKTYKSSPYQLDMFSIFMEKASILCKTSGHIGQIVPNVWLTNMYSSSTRAFVLEQSHELKILLPPPNVFPGLTVDTIVYTYKKANEPGNTFAISVMKNGGIEDLAILESKDYLNGERPISTSLDINSAALVHRLKTSFSELGSFADITRGVHPYRTGGYGQTAFGSGPQTIRDVKERPYHSKEEKDEYRPFIYGKDLKRFTPPIANEFIHYGTWLAEPRNPMFFEGPRVYSRKILADRLLVTLETSDTVADQQVYITKPKNDLAHAAYLAGVLGSKLIAFFIRGYFDEANDAFPQIKVGQLRSLPIPGITSKEDLARHDRMVALVQSMLDLHQRLAAAQTPTEKTMLQRQITATDRQIDRLVYVLYGLTEEEVGIVEA